ncbi:MAG: hypothetical protein NC392_12185 [Roseburia sp.]|nr:hypothetical protein [Roseburia sp.]
MRIHTLYHIVSYYPVGSFVSKKRFSLQKLFNKLDEAIEDMENGRVQTIEEAWEDLPKKLKQPLKN